MGVNRRYDESLLREAALASISYPVVLRYLGLGQAHGRGRPSVRRRAPSEILVRRPPGALREKPPVLRRALTELGRPYLCAHCSLDPDEIHLTLHVDHINGDWLDNRPDNLRFLCPNCHAQTTSYCVPRGAVAQRQRRTI